jgi:hypothetical protein
VRWFVALAVCVTLLGCGPGSVPTPTGPRQLNFNVRNESDQEVRIVITRNSDMALAGSMDPSFVPPRTLLPIILTVPEGNEWALYIEPSMSDIGPLIFGTDLAGCRGVIRLEIQVDTQGFVDRTPKGRVC